MGFVDTARHSYLLHRSADRPADRDCVQLATGLEGKRLRHIERERILLSSPYSTRPPRMEYTLTGDGRDLASALRLLAAWGTRRTGGEPLRHDRCGTAVEARWYCPTCAVAITDVEITGAEETRLV